MVINYGKEISITTFGILLMNLSLEQKKSKDLQED